MNTCVVQISHHDSEMGKMVSGDNSSTAERREILMNAAILYIHYPFIIIVSRSQPRDIHQIYMHDMTTGILSFLLISVK